MEIRCRFFVPTGRVALSLRRYASRKCPGKLPYCDARFPIGEADARTDDRGYLIEPIYIPRHDPRWPIECECGYSFADRDEWQVFQDQIYQEQNGTDEFPLRELPVGAMWNAWWFSHPRKHQDGLSLCVRTPGGEWAIDGPSKNGPGWTRRGTPPNITVEPSIICGSYHGWLRDGILVTV